MGVDVGVIVIVRDLDYGINNVVQLRPFLLQHYYTQFR